jgi:iron complex outermembrane receptor protein
VGFGAQFEKSRFGMPFADQFHEHGGGEEEEEEEEHLEVDVKADRRDIRIDGGLRSLQNAFADAVKLTFNYTDYAHDEIETIAGVDEVGTAFSNKTSTFRGEIEQQRRGRLTGRIGFEWFGRDYDVVGEEALAPPTTQSSIAGFAYEELNLGRYRLQFGGRVERTAYEPGPRPEHIDEPGGEEHEPPPVRDRTFTGFSGSFGVHASIGAHGAFVANVTGASRAPALEELYNFGPHIGNLAFEIGNPDLELEKSFGIDLSLRSRSPRVQAELNFFTYNISNFVFLEFTGEIEHGLREAEFLQGDSRFIGVEGSGSFEVGGGSHLHASLSYVQAKLTDTDAYLPRIPPLSGRVELEIPWRDFTFSPEVVFAADQDNVSSGETATAGYGVFNLGGTYFLASGHATHAITVKAFNLTDAEYRRHTSFIKDLTPEIGRGVRVSYTVRFF